MSSLSKQRKVSILDRVRRLKKAFENGEIPTLSHHAVNPGLPKDDRINYIYFTLPASINFQRSSPAMWTSALKTYEDPETNYLFYPERVVITPREKVQADLVKHRLALQQNKHVDIWRKLSETFHELYAGDPRNLFSANGNDVPTILETIRVKLKPHFPYLSGGKLSNYWLFMLSQFTDIKLQNIHRISIIPDTHVIQASKVLGLTSEKSSPDHVADRWFELLDGSELTPIEMHPVLWNWSRAKFQPAV